MVWSAPDGRRFAAPSNSRYQHSESMEVSTMVPNAQVVWQWREGVDAYRGSRVGGMSVVGYDVEATDGRVGTVHESSGRFGTYCLVVDADPWIAGRRILVPAATVREIDRADRTVHIDRSRADVEASPGYNPETFSRPQYRDRVAHYFAGLYRDTSPH
jgi:hypothetical protein